MKVKRNKRNQLHLQPELENEKRGQTEATDFQRVWTNLVGIIVYLFIVLVTPHTRCKLKLLRLERVKDYLIMETEFISNQERLKPREEKTLVCDFYISCLLMEILFIL